MKSAANTNASASATADTPGRRPSIDDDAMLSSVTFSEYKAWMQSQLSPIPKKMLRKLEDTQTP